MILDLFCKDIGFDNIHGYDDIKDIVRRVLDAEENYNLLFVGPPASAKTLFLLGILEFKKGVYFDGSNTTNRILDVLEENRPKIICIDEIRCPNDFRRICSTSWTVDTLRWIRCANNMILKSREQKCLEHAMKSQGYQNPCNPGFGGCISPHILKPTQAIK